MHNDNIIALRHFKMCLELTVNNPDLIEVINGKPYISCENLRGELLQIREMLIEETGHE